MTRFLRVPPYEILVFPTNFIFFQRNEITLKSVLPFSKLIIGKSQVSSTRSHVLYVTDGANRVQLGGAGRASLSMMSFLAAVDCAKLDNASVLIVTFVPTMLYLRYYVTK